MKGPLSNRYWSIYDHEHYIWIHEKSQQKSIKKSNKFIMFYIKMRRKEQEILIWIILITILVIWSYLYKHIVVFTLIILLIVFIPFLIWWIYYYNKTERRYNLIRDNNNYNNKLIWVLLIIISIFPWYFMGYIMFNYDESQKYLQEKSIEWITGLWKAAFAVLKPKAFLKSELKTEIGQDLINNLEKENIQTWTNNN